MGRHVPVRLSIGLGAVFLTVLTIQGVGASENKQLDLATKPVIANLLSAWRHADARAIAAQYEPDGDFISPSGTYAAGRRAIEAFYSRAFGGGYAGSEATATVVHVRSFSPALALLDGTWMIEPTSTSKITQPESGVFVAVLRKHNGRWWIAALREHSQD